MSYVSYDRSGITGTVFKIHTAGIFHGPSLMKGNGAHLTDRSRILRFKCKNR